VGVWGYKHYHRARQGLLSSKARAAFSSFSVWVWRVIASYECYWSLVNTKHTNKSTMSTRHEAAVNAASGKIASSEQRADVYPIG